MPRTEHDSEVLFNFQALHQVESSAVNITVDQGLASLGTSSFNPPLSLRLTQPFHRSCSRARGQGGT